MTKYTDEDLIVSEILAIIASVKRSPALDKYKILTPREVAEYYEVKYDTIKKMNQRADSFTLRLSGIQFLPYDQLKEVFKHKDTRRLSTRGGYAYSPMGVISTAARLSDSLIAEKVRREMALSDNVLIRKILINNNSRVKWKQREVHKSLSKSFEGVFSIESESTI